MQNIKSVFPEKIQKILFQHKLRKVQKEALKHINSNLVISAPTGSGKTLIAEAAFLNTILNKKKKAIYIVPLKALANEKYNDFKKKYSEFLRIGIATGDLDRKDEKLEHYDLIILTSEKTDSLIRHNVSWLNEIGLVIADEIHLLNDSKRGPPLELTLTYFKNRQIIGLSATIGNSDELADWLNAFLIESDERPVRLDYGVLFQDTIYFD